MVEKLAEAVQEALEPFVARLARIERLLEKEQDGRGLTNEQEGADDFSRIPLPRGA